MNECELRLELMKANLEATMNERDLAIRLLREVVRLPDDCRKTCAEYETVVETGCDLDCEDCDREQCPCWQCMRSGNWRNWNMKAPGGVNDERRKMDSWI